MASYSEACLGLPWRTAALDRLRQDEATRYAVHGLALSAAWPSAVQCVGEFDAAPHFLTRNQ